MAQESGGTEGQGQDKLINFLIGQLNHSYYDIRSAAAIALGKAGDERAVVPLSDLTTDSNKTVVESAILALGMLKSREAVPLLIEIVRNPKQAFRFRVYAAIALGLLGDPSAAREMMTVISKKKEHEEVQAACLLGLALMKYEPSAPQMIQVLSNARLKANLRAVAATSLGKLNVHTVKMKGSRVPVLRYLIRVLQTCKKDHEIRQSAVLAISALGPTGDLSQEKLLSALAQAYNDRNDDVKCLTLMGIAELAKKGKALNKAQAIFRSRLVSERNAKIKCFAALAAGLSGDRESIEPLRKILKFGGNPAVRSASAVGLGLLKDVGSTKDVLGIIEGKGDKNLKGYCCVCLGLMGAKDNKEALPRLKQVVSEASDPELRAAAAMALTQLGDNSALKILLEVLNTSNAYFKMSAIMAIAAFRDLSAVTPLIDLFNSSTVNDETKAIIMVALGHIAESREVPILKRLGLHYNFLLDRYPTIKEIVNLL
jgi:HEAT repeat protein